MLPGQIFIAPFLLDLVCQVVVKETCSVYFTFPLSLTQDAALLQVASKQCKLLKNTEEASVGSHICF